MKTKKIALFVPNLGGGGAERMMVNLAHGLTTHGLLVDVVLASAEGPYLTQLPDEVKVIDLQAKSVLRSLPSLVTYLKREQPNVLVSTLHYANIVALWATKLAGVSTRVFLREANMLTVGNGSLKSRGILMLARRFYPWAEGVVAVSNGVAEDVRNFINLRPQQVYTIYNPVVTDDIASQSNEPVNHPWFSQVKPIIILGVGRLNAQKDFGTLIRAFKLVKQARPAKLVILGEGEGRTSLQSLISDLDLTQDVDMPGFVDNPFAYMSKASVFVLSSAWEGLPGVLIQALACGCPAVSTDCPSGPSEILEGGRYGELVPVGDAAAMAAAVVRTLNAPLASEVLKNRAQAFSVEASTKAYLEVLNL